MTSVASRAGRAPFALAVAHLLWISVVCSAVAGAQSRARGGRDGRGDARSGARHDAVNDGQTVQDPILGVYWLADANLPATQTFGVNNINKSGSMDYETALRWIRAMNAYDHGRGYLGHNNWMLPTTPSSDPKCSAKNKRGGGTFGYGCVASALGSLYYKSLSLREPDTAVPVRDNKTGPFVNFQPYIYWTAEPTKIKSQGFVTFSFNSGWEGANVFKHYIYVLPMMKGRLLGPRSETRGLESSADGKTVYDPQTDITWLADADLAATQRFGVGGINRDGAMEHTTAAQWIDSMNKARWLGQSRWELPPSTTCGGFGCKNTPLGQLFFQALGHVKGEPVVAVPDSRVGEFHNLQPYLYWSCAGENIHGPCKGAPAPGFAWSFSFGNGFQGTDLVANNLYVTAYYATNTNILPPPRPASHAR